MDGDSSRSATQSPSETRTKGGAAEEASTHDARSRRSNGLPRSSSEPRPMSEGSAAAAASLRTLSAASVTTGEGEEGSEADDGQGETPCRTSSAYILLQLRDLGRTASSGSGSTDAAKALSFSSSPMAVTRSNTAPATATTPITAGQRAQDTPTSSSDFMHRAGNMNSSQIKRRSDERTANSGRTQERITAGLVGGAATAAAAAVGIERGMYVAGLLPGFQGAVSPAAASTPVPSSPIVQQQQKQAASSAAALPQATPTRPATTTGASASRVQGRTPSRTSGAGMQQARSATKAQGGRRTPPPTHARQAGGEARGAAGAVTSSAAAGGLQSLVPRGAVTEGMAVLPTTGQLVPVRQDSLSGLVT